MGRICYWVFNMSIIASFMGLLVLLIRKLKGIPRRIFVFLWAIPFLRMCFPLGINSRYSLMPLISKLTTKTVTVYQPVNELELSYSNVIMQAESYSPFTFKTEFLKTVFEIAGLIWLIGALQAQLGILYLCGNTDAAGKLHILDGSEIRTMKIQAQST